MILMSNKLARSQSTNNKRCLKTLKRSDVNYDDAEILFEAS